MHSSSRPTPSSTRTGPSPHPRPNHANTHVKVLDSVHGRILCIADIRGRHSALNDLAREANAKAIIHTGDFGFFEANSLERINDRTLRHLTQYSPLIPNAQRSHLLAPENTPASIRATVNINLLSEFPLLLSGQIKLQVPVYAVYGACEDVNVLEKFRNGTYYVENLQVLDEATTRCLDVGGVKLRLLGLGGALVPHKLFDNGEGNATIAGGQGTMWTTALQIGELVDTAQRVFDPSETRLLVTHASPGREGIIAQLALVLKVDLTVSAGLHFRYGSSYNEFSVHSEPESLRKKLADGKEVFDKVWESVKGQVEAAIDDNQRVLLDKALSVVERVPPPQTHGGPGAGPPGAEEPAWKNCWNWNLCDAAFGTLVLDIKDGRVSAELKSQGFNYAYRRTATAAVTATPNSAHVTLPPNATHTNSVASPSSRKSGTPVPPPLPTPSSSEKPPPAAGVLSTAEPKSSESAPHQPPQPGMHEPPAASTSGWETPKDGSPSTNNNHSGGGGGSNAKTNGVKQSPNDKTKKKPNKKDRQFKEESEAKDGGSGGEGAPSAGVVGAAAPSSSGKATPQLPPESSTPDDVEQPLKSPVDGGSGGARTPTTKRPPRNPWTIFMRMSVGANEPEVREFFGAAKDGITRVNYPYSVGGRQQKLVYVEFGDEQAMRQGLEKHAEKLHDAVPLEVVQATDRESRGESPHYSRGGGWPGRGRGRGSYASRGFAAAGLTRNPKEGGGEGPSVAKSSEGA